MYGLNPINSLLIEDFIFIFSLINVGLFYDFAKRDFTKQTSLTNEANKFDENKQKIIL